MDCNDSMCGICDRDFEDKIGILNVYANDPSVKNDIIIVVQYLSMLLKNP